MVKGLVLEGGRRDESEIKTDITLINIDCPFSLQPVKCSGCRKGLGMEAMIPKSKT